MISSGGNVLVSSNTGGAGYTLLQPEQELLLPSHPLFTVLPTENNNRNSNDDVDIANNWPRRSSFLLSYLAEPSRTSVAGRIHEPA